MKWGNEAIAGYCSTSTLAAWLVPSVKSIVVLALSSVDGDPVAGIYMQAIRAGTTCAASCWRCWSFTSSLAPCSCWPASCVARPVIRSVIKQQGGPTKTHKLEKLMIRLSLFTVLYTVPAAVVVACLFLRAAQPPCWEATHNCPCLRDLQPDQAPARLRGLHARYFMCLVVGITSGCRVWSGKTLESWRAVHPLLLASKGAARRAW